MARDYYQILGVEEKAGADEIKRRYRELAKKYHPDRNKGNKAAEDKFKEVSGAYDVLRDEKKRRQYDTMRRFGGSGDRAGGGFPGGGGGRFYTNTDFEQAFGGDFKVDDLFGFGGLGDIFSSIFGDNLRARTRRGGFGTRPGRETLSARHLRITLKIPLAEAISGARRRIRIDIPEPCPTCQATGFAAGGVQVCSRCGGTGQVTHAQGAFSISRPCPSCLGQGVQPGQVCLQCHGSGVAKKRKTIAVKIPPGIEDGGSIRLRGLGYPGKNGVPRGDLIIKVRIMNDQKFAREGNDIVTSVNLSFPQAALGTKVAVRTLSKKVMLTVPAGTQPGAIMRLRGAGLTVGDQTGDMLVTVNVNVPTDLTERQKELLREFEALAPAAA